MGGPVSVQRVLDNYLKLYVRPEWQETTQAVLTALADHLSGLQQESGIIDLDPNSVDDLLGSLADEGQGVEVVLPVVADALEFLCTRRVIAANPLAPAAHGETNRLSRTPVAVNVPAQPVPAAASTSTAKCANYRTLREALNYLFPADPVTKTRSRVGYSESTIMDTYLPKWEKLFAYLEKRRITEVQHVTQSHLKAFVDSLPRNMAPQTRNSYIHAYRAFWNQLIDDGVVSSTENPAALRLMTVRKKDKTERTPLTVAELGRLLTHLDRIEDEFERRSQRALVLTEAFGGPRVFEGVAINFEDVDWTTGVVHIRRGKGDVERDTVLIQAALDDLHWLKEYRGARDSAALFVNLPRGRGRGKAEQRITKNTAWRWLKALEEDTGVYMYNHRLRHTAGTLAEQFGGPAYRRALGIANEKGKADPLSMSLLGHSSPAVNAKYNHVPLDAVRVVMEEAYQHVRAVGRAAGNPASEEVPASAA